MSGLRALRDFVLEPADAAATPDACATARCDGGGPDLATPVAPAAGPQETIAPVAHLRVVATTAATRDLVLGPSRTGLPVAVALAGARRRAAGAACAVLAVWGPAASCGPAAAAARRTTARLVDRDLPASAAGRLACVALPPGDEEAADVLRRLLVATPDVPVVTLLAGARGDALDGLVDRFDAALLAGVDPLVAEHAAAHLPVPCRAVAPPLGPLDRALAAAGRSRASLRRSVA